MEEFRAMGAGYVWKDPLRDAPAGISLEEMKKRLISGDLIVRKGGNNIHFRCKDRGADLVSVSFAIASTNTSNLHERSLSGPIQPPVGYEDYDLSPDRSKYERVEADAKHRAEFESGQETDPMKSQGAGSLVVQDQGGGALKWIIGLVGLFAVLVIGMLIAGRIREK
jgi:hypothetical protein